MKTSELTGAALDWAVAKCEGYEINKMHAFDGERACMGVIGHGYSPSTDWAQGGPIIEREKITWAGQSARICKYFGGHTWQNLEEFGPSPLIAAMRCYVASKLGDEIDIPEALK